MVKHAHIADAICAVMAEVGQIERDRKIDGGGARYAYLSDDAVVAKVQASMARNGLALVPETMAIIDHPVVKTSRGETVGLRILVEWRLHHETGTIPLATIGEGNDSGDKGSNKAMTAARKYAMRLAFSIASGDDPDDERPETGARGVPRQTERPVERPATQPSVSPATVAARSAFAFLRNSDAKDHATRLGKIISANGNECPDKLGAHLDSALELSGPDRLQAVCEVVDNWRG